MPRWPTITPHEDVWTSRHPLRSSPRCCTSNGNPPPGLRRDDEEDASLTCLVSPRLVPHTAEKWEELLMAGEMDAVHARSLADPEGFWGEAAAGIDWIEPWRRVLDGGGK